VTPFEREARCGACGREYVVSGVALHPGAETEGPTRIPCPSCGGEITAFVPGSVNTERLVVREKPGREPGPRA
jgi:DNA-directed RNA polymerase subunit RPC12/RpoP